MSLASGTRLGPYELIAPLGAGGMGEVYCAKDSRLGRTVAIKVLPPDTAADASARVRFEREARAIAALSHPNICVVHDVGREGSTDYLVMELLDGETLFERLAKSKGPLPLDEVLTVGTAIADALDKAHRAGVVHRDLKPLNVMLTKSGPKLLDFGLAKLHTRESGPVALSEGTAASTMAPGTAHGTILGTLHYMAPEQVEGREADARADIWALGALLYEMATGTRPFDGESPASVLGAILKDTPAPLSARQPLTPPAFERLVRKCLKKERSERWQTATDLRDELEWIHEGSAAVTGTGEQRKARARMPWVIAAIATLAAVLMVASSLSRGEPVVSPPSAVRFDIPTPPTDEATSFELSPDGRELAYVAALPGEPSRLWVRSLDSIKAEPIPRTEGATYPFWSPDSTALGYFANGKLMRIDRHGETPLELASAPSARGRTWNREGVILFAGQTVSGLSRVAATGGAIAPVAREGFGKPANGVRWPRFLPDGRHFICFIPSVGTEERGIYFGSLDAPGLTRVMTSESAGYFSEPGLLLAVRQQRLESWPFDWQRGTLGGESSTVVAPVGVDTNVGRGAFSTSHSGVLAHSTAENPRRAIIVVDRTGQLSGPPILDDDATGFSGPNLSPDGRRLLLYRMLQGNVDVWIADVSRRVQSRFTSEPRSDVSGIWAPDQRRVMFSSVRNGNYDLFEKPADGLGEEHPVLVSPETKYPLSWSPDGRHLLYRSTNLETGVLELWVLPLEGDRQPFPVVQSAFDAAEGQFSPDGRWIAYASDESGRRDVYVRPFPGPGTPIQVSSGGGSQVRWRRDGKELYFVAVNAALMAVRVEGHADKRTVILGAPVSLFQTHFATGANVTGIAPQYEVSPDGHFIMNINKSDADSHPIGIVLNWQTLLKR